jgi:hypothetical protein
VAERAVVAHGAGVPVEPPGVVLLERGVRARKRPRVWRTAPGALLAAAVASAVASVALGPLGLVAAGVLLGAAPAMAVSRRRRILGAAAVPPDLVQAACGLADGLHAAGLTAAGAESVDWHLDSDGQVRFVLDPGSAGTRDSEVFAQALAELVAPIGAPRYLVPRYVADGVTVVDGLRPLASYRPDRVVWHPVPSVLGVRAELAQAFAAAWVAWVGGGPAVYTGRPEGAGVLAACRGTDPWDVTSVLRRSWS